MRRYFIYIFFFFNDTATTEIYTLSLHDALPISLRVEREGKVQRFTPIAPCDSTLEQPAEDRKSTRLNSSHGYISYAVFCLKKKKHLDILGYIHTPPSMRRDRLGPSRALFQTLQR